MFFLNCAIAQTQVKTELISQPVFFHDLGALLDMT